MKRKTCGDCIFYHGIHDDCGVCTLSETDETFDKTCDFVYSCKDFQPKQLITNGDRIWQGGNRELAECCVYEVGNMFASTLIADKTFETYEDAVDATGSWLNAPAESEG